MRGISRQRTRFGLAIDALVATVVPLPAMEAQDVHACRRRPPATLSLRLERLPHARDAVIRRHRGPLPGAILPPPLWPPRTLCYSSIQSGGALSARPSPSIQPRINRNGRPPYLNCYCADLTRKHTTLRGFVLSFRCVLALVCFVLTLLHDPVVGEEPCPRYREAWLREALAFHNLSRQNSARP